MSKKILLISLLGLVMGFAGESQAQFITIARKIKSMNHPCFAF